jgi:hypothetical protein
MKASSFKLLKFVFIALIVGTAILSVLQLETPADAEVLLCTHTGQPCFEDDDCTRNNPTCFCANANPDIGQAGICREDFALPPIGK